MVHGISVDYILKTQTIMKIIICDVGDAACAFLTSPNAYTMMIDCGSSDDKTNPVDLFKSNKQWLGTKDYITRFGQSYPIALLHITHPDKDHVRNAYRVATETPPYILHKVMSEEYSDGNDVDINYRNYLDRPYRWNNPETIHWGFEINKTFQIPVSICQSNPDLKSKERNNSSIIRYVKADGVSVLFCGDLETPGWEYLIEHNPDFVKIIKDNGVNILIAPHHGHKSGFPKALFDIIGNVDLVIHSKDTEASKEGTDVSSQYSSKSNGHKYQSLTDGCFYWARVMTTRSNGNIFISTNGDGSFHVQSSKASPNHELA